MRILETHDLHHDFNGLQVISGIDLSVEQGQRHALIGPNGAGKTTLFNIIMGAYVPRSGRVLFRGEDITGFASHRPARLGISRSFQITSTFPRLTAFENMRLAVLARRGVRLDIFHRVRRMSQVCGETESVLRRVQLYDVRHQPASGLSYGQNRALELGLAMAADAQLVLLDEPTAGMSKEETLESIELIRDLSKGKTVVIVEHDMDVVFSLADHITVLNRGRILTSGPPQDVREDPRVKDAYLGHDSS